MAAVIIGEDEHDDETGGEAGIIVGLKLFSTASLSLLSLARLFWNQIFTCGVKKMK